MESVTDVDLDEVGPLLALESQVASSLGDQVLDALFHGRVLEFLPASGSSSGRPAKVTVTIRRTRTTRRTTMSGEKLVLENA